ncbi:MAG: hypothetical protein NT133_15690 [Alphaproteobacteria bacterium]|nr:hypothetical protein [Alphaproteobacteria bacterium]
MRTLVFCTAYAANQDIWERRYRRWLDAILASDLAADQILLVDDGSPVLPDWDDATIVDQAGPHEGHVVLHHFADRLGRRSLLDFPGWYRSFCHAARHAEAGGFDKIVHIESDTYLITPRVRGYVNSITEGWTALWCPRHGFAETAIQIMAGNGATAYRALADRPHSDFAGREFEIQLPFSHVERGFIGDRYGETAAPVPRDADYAVQALESFDDTYFWFLPPRRAHDIPTRRPAPPGAERYLDLLERSLTGTMWHDPNFAPGLPATFDAPRRAEGRDWPLTAPTMMGAARLANLRLLAEAALQENIPGDFIEAGLWRGGGAILLRAVLAAYGDPARLVWAADSFQGPPAPDPTFPHDAGDGHHTIPALAVSRLDVERNFRHHGLLDPQVKFLAGWFADTLPIFPGERLALIRLDGILYSSTIQALEALYPRLSPGGFVTINGYAFAACARAVDDFRTRHHIRAPLHRIDWTGRWWRKPR